MLREYLAATAAEPAVTLESFMAACTERDLVRADLFRQVREVPILLSPVSTVPAFQHGAGQIIAPAMRTITGHHAPLSVG